MDNALLPGLGGPMGRHAEVRGLWFNPLPWAFLAAVAAFLVLALRHVPCVQVDADDAINSYIRLCYSDIPSVFYARGFGLGASPVRGEQLAESPLVAVLMAIIMFVVSAVTLVGPAATPQQVVDAGVVFFAVSVAVLFVCFLVAVLAVSLIGRPAPGRATSWDGVLFAASPIVIAAGLVSWTMLPLALACVGLLQLRRRRTVEAGVVLGLAACAGTMPIAVVFAVVVVIGLRAGLLRAAAFISAAVVSFALVHVPLFVVNADQVYAYYHAEMNKDVSYGSLWYVASLMGLGTRGVGSLAFTVLLMLALAGLVGFLYVSGRRPRVGSMVAAVILLVCVLSATFTPQTSLWVLLAVVLARPYRRDLLAVTITQLAYWAAVWPWLGGSLTSAQFGPYLLYWFAVIAHIAVQVVVLVDVIRDMVSPQRDRMRTPDLPDPLGGILNDAELVPAPAEPSEEDASAEPAETAAQAVPHHAASAGYTQPPASPASPRHAVRARRGIPAD